MLIKIQIIIYKINVRNTIDLESDMFNRKYLAMEIIIFIISLEND